MDARHGNAFYTPVQQLHKSRFGCNAEKIVPLTSHGSDRIILRMFSEQSGTSIGIINNHPGENKAFIAFAAHFRKYGLNVPEIFNQSPDGSTYLMEDLGDTTLLKKIYSENNSGFGENELNLYLKVSEILPQFQVRAGNTIDYSYCYQFSEFAEENIRFDINYFNERFLNNFCREDIKAAELEKEYSLLISMLLEIERENFLYRDFQSRNIMLRGEEFYFIDFQSGRRGALLYDIASLLYDARAKVPQHYREQILDYYLDVLCNIKKIEKNKYRDYFWYFALIRIMQAMGAYGYLGITKGKSRFLESIPLALNNIRFILNEKLDKNNFPQLKKIFTEIII